MRTLSMIILKAYQEKVEVQFDDLPVPIMGYVDFYLKIR